MASEPASPSDPESWRADTARLLAQLAEWRMPFGKYGPENYPPDGLPLYQLPAEYLIWFKNKGFPKGRLGELLSALCEIHLTGAEGILAPLRQQAGNARPLRKPRRRVWEFPENG